MKQIMPHSIRCMANSVDSDQPASHAADLDPHCLQRSLSKGHNMFRKLKILNWFCLSNNAVYIICNVTKKIVLRFSVKKQVDQHLYYIPINDTTFELSVFWP